MKNWLFFASLLIYSVSALAVPSITIPPPPITWTGSGPGGKVTGSLSVSTRTISGTTYTVDSSGGDVQILTNSSSNAIAITLPVPALGREISIYDMAGSAATNHVTISHNASETINGLTSLVIAGNYGGYTFTSDGTNWFASSLPMSGASFLTSGTSYTTPVNITKSTRWKFTLVGGGGGGAGITGANGDKAAGGGAGQVCVLYTTGLSPNTAYTIAIGSNGTGGATSGSGGSGGSTSLTIGATTYTVSGGTGATTGVSEQGGVGGTGTSGCTFQINGQNGGGAGAGGAGGTTATSGAGGSSGLGMGFGGSPVEGASGGLAGTGYGSGGSGGSSTGTAETGGAGTGGAILAEWTN